MARTALHTDKGHNTGRWQAARLAKVSRPTTSTKHTRCLLTQVSAHEHAPSTPRTVDVRRVDGALDPDLALLDIKVRELRVPKVGGTKTDKNRSVTKYVLGPDGQEVMWVTRVCNALLAELAPDTCNAYAKSFYRAAVVIWALGKDPQHMTPIQWAVVRAWLRDCMRRTAQVPGDCAGPLSPSTVAGTEAAMLSIYDKAVELGLVASNPVALLRSTAPKHFGEQTYDTPYGGGSHPASGGRRRGTVRVPQKQIKTLSDDLQQRLKNARRSRDRALWTLCLDTGPRIREALSLTPGTYFPDENYALVVGKGLDGGRRIIPVSDATVEAIDVYLTELARLGFRPAPEDHIFRHVKKPYAPLEYGGAWAALRRALGKRDVHPHALRHTAATEMLRLIDDPEGKGLVSVKVMLGHGNVAVTGRYLHLTNREVVADVVKARNSPRRRSAELAGIYKPEHLATLNAILKEASE